jgi:hypothetical protein
MQVLTFEEINAVDNLGGGVTENECTGVLTFGGALLGGIGGALVSGGLFSVAGAGFGGMLGNAAGNVWCGGFIRNAPKPA